MSEGQSYEVRRLPTWVAILVVLLFLGGAGFFLWQQLGPGKSEQAVVVNPRPPSANADGPGARGGGRGQRGTWTMPMGDGVRQSRDGDWRIKAGEFIASVGPGDGGQIEHRIDIITASVLSQDVIRSLSVRRWILRSPGAQAALKLTDGQMQQLRDIGQGSLIASAKELEKFKALWNAYDKAGDGQPKTDAENALVAGLKEIGQANLDATKQSYAQRAAKVKQVLTPEQFDQATREMAQASPAARGPRTTTSAPTK